MNLEALQNAIISNLDENIVGRYDMSTILRSAKYCWDNTAIEVRSTDFVMVFDELSYELLDYTGFDINE